MPSLDRSALRLVASAMVKIGAKRSGAHPRTMPEESSLEPSRLLTLEEKAAYQERTIADLSDMIIELRRDLMKLESRIKAVEGVVRAPLDAPDAADEKPPHY
jgi:uncharacterized coiled-coil protein SlyX